MDKYELEEKIAKTEHLVEADSFASTCLWERWAVDADRSGTPSERRLSWKEHSRGIGLEVGRLDDRPVMVTLFWNTIGGALVCFYHSDSQVVDRRMVEGFLRERFPDVPIRDALNFHNVVLDIGRRDAEPVELTEDKRVLGREVVEDFQKDGLLTTRAFETSLLAKERGEDGAEGVYYAVMTVAAQCDRFRDLVWIPWLKDYYDAASNRGHETNAGKVQMMVYGLAGRVMVSLRLRDAEGDRETWYVSLLGYEGAETSMHVRGGLGNFGVLESLIAAAAEASDALRADIHPDDAVRLAV